MSEFKVTIPVGLDVQTMYDHACGMERAFGSMADSLASMPSVCTHRYTPKGEVDDETVACGGCGHLVPMWITET